MHLHIYGLSGVSPSDPHRVNPLRAAYCFNAYRYMPFVDMMQECIKHYVDPTGVIHSQRIGMIHECNPGELLARPRAAFDFMHHVDKGHKTP